MGAAVKQVGGKGRKRASTGKSKDRFASPLDKAKAFEIVWDRVAPVFEITRQVVNPSYVYVIGEEDSGPVKIGVAKDPIMRLRAMQTGNPRRLRIEHLLVGDMQIEKLLHEFWESHAIKSHLGRKRIKGAPGTEWFEPTARSQLGPIVAAAARAQVDFIEEQLSGDGMIGLGELERCVRTAHKEFSGFTVQGRDETRLLAAGAGYVISRPSRI